MAERFRIKFEGEMELSAEEVFPEGVPGMVNLLRDFKGVTIQELLINWGLIEEMVVVVRDTKTGKTITRSRMVDWSEK